MRLKNQIIASFEDANPRVEASTIDAETQEVIDERVAVAEEIGELDAEGQEAKDVEEQLEADIESVENYIIVLNQQGALSQESHMLALCGLDNIFNRYGIGHKLPSAESFGADSKDTLVASLEGVLGKMWEGLKNASDKVLSVFTKRLDANTKMKTDLVARLRAIQTEGGEGTYEINGSPFGLNTKAGDIKKVIDSSIEMFNAIGDAANTHFSFFEKEITAMEQSKWWKSFENLKDVSDHFADTLSPFMSKQYKKAKSTDKVTTFETNYIFGGEVAFDANTDGEVISFTGAKRKPTGGSYKLEHMPDVVKVATKLADAVEASMNFERDRKRVDSAFASWKGLLNVNWTTILAGAGVGIAGALLGVGAAAAVAGAANVAASGQAYSSAALSAIFRAYRNILLEPVSVPNDQMLMSLTKVTAYLEASAKPVPAAE